LKTGKQEVELDLKGELLHVLVERGEKGILLV